MGEGGGGIYPPLYVRGLTDRGKYRPIFLPIIFKRVWTLCYKQLQQHASKHKFIAEEHFAYSRNSSTFSQVLKRIISHGVPQKKNSYWWPLMFLYSDDTEVHRSGSDLEVLVNEDLQNFAS